MTPREFFYLVCQMREAQKTYFANRSQENLRRARAYEGDVDREIRRAKLIIADRKCESEPGSGGSEA